jgi:Transglutaminase-like superfamily
MAFFLLQNGSSFPTMLAMNLESRSRLFVLLVIVLTKAIAFAVTNTVSSNELVSKNLSPPPTNLTQLLALSPEQLEKCDIARMNLLCAEDLRGSENLDVQQNLNTLDSWTRHVEDETTRNYHRFLEHPEEYKNSKAYFRMAMLAMVLQEDFQTHYAPERAIPQILGKREPNDVFFADSKDVFIHGLLGGERHGTCSSLPVLYAAVAQRLGYPVNLASTKDHLYLRYEEGANHLNVDAAGDGFITHSDDEYRKWPFPISDEEIKTYGYLRPMSQREILGAFLVIRAGSLTSMKRLDEAAESWEAASRYLPETPVLKQLVARAKERAENVHKADRWDEFWDQVVTQPLPDKEPKSQYFQDRQAQVLLFMNRSTDLTAIEKAATNLKNEVDAYAKAMTTDIHKVQFRISLVPPPMPRMPSEPPMPGNDAGTILIAREQLPLAYFVLPWHSWSRGAIHSHRSISATELLPPLK